MTKLTFAAPPSPIVSVIFVTFNSAASIQESLSALRQNTDASFEVLIVDNASQDGTPEVLESDVTGADITFNDFNVGFAAANNQAAARARGMYLCFLNPDVIVRPGWLPPLLGSLEHDDRTAAAIPMMLHPDGRLQEAGSVVFADGGTRAVGDGEDPDNYAYRFPRYVDYGSAACLLIRRSTFCDVGGFDAAYSPGYGEDVDLSFELAERGLLTRYEPASQIVHVRSQSSTASAAAKLMVEHRSILMKRWRSTLDARPHPDVESGPHRLIAARDAEAFPRFLIIDDRIPHVDRGSGDPRMARLLSELAEIWPTGRVTLLAVDGVRREEYAPALLRRGVEIAFGPQDWNLWFASRLCHYCVVVISRPHNFPNFYHLVRATQPQATLVYDTEALFSRRLERMVDVARSTSERARRLADASQMRELEIQIAREADAILYVTEEERAFLKDNAPDNPVFRVGFATELHNTPPGFDERQDLLFFGSFMAGVSSPNEDGAMYLVREVMPKIWAHDPTIKLHIVGADPTRDVMRLESERINVVGGVREPYEWLSRARLHIGPLRYAAGIKLRFIDSMAAGLPFVTTPIGAEGLGLGSLAEYLVAETSSDLAGKTWRLYSDRDRWNEAARGVLDLASSAFSPAAFRSEVKRAMIGCGAQPPEFALPTIRSRLSQARRP